MLDPRQRRDLLRIEQSRDAYAIGAAIDQVLSDNPDADLLEIEQLLRAAASTAYLVAADDGVHGRHRYAGLGRELNRLGRTPEQNRQLLAGEPGTPFRPLQALALRLRRRPTCRRGIPAAISAIALDALAECYNCWNIPTVTVFFLHCN